MRPEKINEAYAHFEEDFCNVDPMAEASLVASANDRE
jgi:hypothetical protein